MVGNTVPIGCNTGLITEFTHVGVYAFGSEAEQKALCSSDTSDNTGNNCADMSSKDSSLFTYMQSQCIGK